MTGEMVLLVNFFLFPNETLLWGHLSPHLAVVGPGTDPVPFSLHTPNFDLFPLSSTEQKSLSLQLPTYQPPLSPPAL